MSDVPLDEVVYVEAISSASTGAAADADSTPTFAVYEEATDTDIGVGGNMTKRTSLTGNYRGSFTASAANGFELGKWYSVIGSATIGGIATKGVLKSFRSVAAEPTAGYSITGAGAGPALYLIRKNGATSNIIRVKLRRLDTGQGLTGLAFDTAGLVVATLTDNESASTAYTAGGSTIETHGGAIGTYSVPTATKCRFVEVDAANQPGLYEIHLADARFAVSGAKVLRIGIFGAVNLRETEVIVQLTAGDLMDTDISGRLPAALTADGLMKSDALRVGGVLNTAGDIIGEMFLRLANKTYYVAASGGDNGNPGTIALPLATYAAAETLAIDGDTIVFLAGTYTTAIVIGKRLTVGGVRRSTSIFQASYVGGLVTVAVSGVMLQNLTVNNTNTSGIAVVLNSSINAPTIYNCSIDGKLDGIVAQGVNGIQLLRSSINSKFDAVTFTLGCKNWLIDQCQITGDGSYAVDSAARGIWCGLSSGGIVRNTNITLTCVSARTSYTAGIAGGGAGRYPILLDNVNITVSLANTNEDDPWPAEGDCYCIGQSIDNEQMFVKVNGGTFKVTNEGTGAAYEINVPDGGRVLLDGTDTDPTKWVGAAYIFRDDQTGDAFARLGEPAGEDVSADNAATLAAAASAATSAGTASTQASAANAKLNANFIQFVSANTSLNTIDDVGGGGGDVDEEAIAAAVVAAMAGTPADFATYPVNSNNVFVLVETNDGLRNEGVKRVTVGETPVAYSVDFRNDVAANQKAFSVSSTSFEEGDDADIDIDAAADWERNGASRFNFMLTPRTVGTYRIRINANYSQPSGTGIGDIVFKVVP